MRTSFLLSAVALPFFATDDAIANAPTVKAAEAAFISDVLAPLGTAAAKQSAKSNVAVKPTTRRLAPSVTGKAVAKPAAKAKADKPADAKAEPAQHSYGTAYRGASPAIRGHGKKLSPIVLNRIPNSFTDRDSALLSALHAHHKLAAFKRLDIDAGALSRLIGHGYVKHASGNLDSRDATFNVTAKAQRERFGTAVAPKA